MNIYIVITWACEIMNKMQFIVRLKPENEIQLYLSRAASGYVKLHWFITCMHNYDWRARHIFIALPYNVRADPTPQDLPESGCKNPYTLRPNANRCNPTQPDSVRRSPTQPVASRRIASHRVAALRVFPVL